MTSETGISRRDVMKKGAVAGAIVWSAPILTSSPAFAADTQCTGGSVPCTNYYFCKLEGSGQGNDPTCDDLEHDIENDLGCAGQTGSVSNGCHLIDWSYDGETVVTIEYDEFVVPIIVQIKTGQGGCFEVRWSDSDRNQTKVVTTAGCTYTLVPSGSVSDGGMTITVTKSGSCQGGGISHVNTYFCN